MERKACQEDIRDVSPTRRPRQGEAVDSQSSTGSTSMTEAVLAKLEAIKAISLNMATKEDMGKLNERLDSWERKGM